MSCMTKRIVALGWAGALMVFFMAAQAQSVKMNPKTDNALLTRFQDAKLGLFVHWMACHTPTTGDSWSIGRGTPKTVADSITMSWNPEKFDARRIVDVAVQSGAGTWLSFPSIMTASASGPALIRILIWTGAPFIGIC